ncbi:MAG: AfsR/SARP family transcriptional regulator, partial [Micromonosporaceae bacterium]
PDADATVASPATQAPPQPAAPALASPLADLWPPAGLGLVGPGAEAAARGLLVSALAAGADDGPEERGRLVVAATTLATLLGAAAVDLPANPRLIITDDLPEALAACEEQALHRSRVLYTHEVDNVAALRDADPFADPLPPMTLLADATARHERARIAALLAQGQRLDIHGVLLGAWPEGDTVTVTDDGAVAPADAHPRHAAHPADIGRLSVLTPDEAVDLLSTFAEAHTGEPHAPAAAPRPAPQPGEEPPDDERTTPAGEQPPPQPKPAAAPVDEAAPDTAPDATPTTGETGAPDTADTRAASPVDAAPGSAPRVDHSHDTTTGGPVSVSVLGEPHIHGAGTTTGPLRAKARELLVYLAAVGGKASQDTVLEDLLPDAPARKAPHRLHTYVYNLRRHLTAVGGKAAYLHHPGHHYVLNTDTLEVDLWQMRDALADAQTAQNPDAKIAALRHAISLYRGPLAEGCHYEWIEPHREGARQQALNAHLALADLIASDQPAEALALAQAAIHVDPYAEAAYRRAMSIYADLGDLDAIRALRRTLTRRMAEIDAEPDDDTLTLADRLIVELQRRRKPRDKAS